MTAPAWRIEAGQVGPVLRAWAAFCLLAGGVYLAVGGAEWLTDTGQLLANGWPHALLVLVGVAVAALGYARSRAAWTALAKMIELTPITWSASAAWWVALMFWCGGQMALHFQIQPA
jgi:hypothetical protein